MYIYDPVSLLIALRSKTKKKKKEKRKAGSNSQNFRNQVRRNLMQWYVK